MTVQAPPIYYALRFLLQWEGKEKVLHRDLVRALSPISVRASLAHFQVARNFPGIKRERRAQFVVRSLVSAESQSNLSPSQRVNFLAERLSQQFDRFNLSAASKLLWLRHRRPYVIFDARAQNALRRLGSEFDQGDYAQYVKAWRARYAEAKACISVACSALATLPGVVPSLPSAERSLSRLVSEQWFQERVFDLYLWERGGDD